MTMKPWIAGGLLFGLLAGLAWVWLQSRSADAASSGRQVAAIVPPPGIRPLPEAPIRRPTVMDISLHDEAALEQLLRRLDAWQREGKLHQGPVAVVLHGPEIAWFTRRAYPEHRALIDLAGRLDAAGVIEVKACRTRMRMMGVREDELPAFVETVPFGPGEVLRLENSGYEVRRLF